MNGEIYIDCTIAADESIEVEITEENSYGEIVDCPFDVLKGEKGDPGPQGPPGPPGPPGSDGIDADVAGCEEATRKAEIAASKCDQVVAEANAAIEHAEIAASGAEWFVRDTQKMIEDGLFNGKDGKDGKDGEQGPAGPPGSDGVDGHTPVIELLDTTTTVNNPNTGRPETIPVTYISIDGVRVAKIGNGYSGKDGEPGPAGHTPTDAELTALINAQGFSKFSGNWNDLNGIPGTFNPSAHKHSATDVSYGAKLDFNVVKNVYISESNGNEIGYNGWDSTDYIDVSNATSISANTVGQYNAWYKSDKTYLSRATFAANTPLAVPSNAKYLRISNTATQILALVVSDSHSTVNDEIEALKSALTTDDHINSLIDAKLGVIENGSY